jgi:CheY-like chemotaxis protein
VQPTVLIADDDCLIRRVLRDLLGATGFNTLQASNGEEGCRIALEQLPDLILMDLEMPVMSGSEACRKLRSFPQFNLIPIILMTSAANLEGILSPFQIGADDYILKPFDQKAGYGISGPQGPGF